MEGGFFSLIVISNLEGEGRCLNLHELSTMDMIIKSVLKAAKEKEAERILEITLEIGELTFLNPEQLKFAFKVLSEGTIIEGAKLRINIVKPRIECMECGFKGEVKYEGPQIHILTSYLPIKCPECGSFNIKFLSGRECTIKSVKLMVKRGF